MIRRCASGSTRTSSGAWFRTSRRASASSPRWSVMWTLRMCRTAMNPGRARSNGWPSLPLWRTADTTGRSAFDIGRARGPSRASAGSRPTGSSARVGQRAINPRPAATGWPRAWPAAPGRCTAGDRRRSCRDPGSGYPRPRAQHDVKRERHPLVAPVAEQDRERRHATRFERRSGLVGRRRALDDGRSRGVEERDRRAGGQRAGSRATVLD